MESRVEIETEISRFLPVQQFLQWMERLTVLRREEEEKLKALAQLQQYYVDANSEAQQEQVKVAVGKIREISRAARTEIREINSEIVKHMPLEQARELFARHQSAE